MSALRSALVSGSFAAILAVVVTVAVSVVVPPPLDLPVLCVLIALAAFSAGTLARYAGDTAD